MIREIYRYTVAILIGLCGTSTAGSTSCIGKYIELGIEPYEYKF
ncbi:hypothetical protein [Clostridium estertheticum]|nr:hypothetical protein [Clostridium estertheticum]